MTPYFLLFVVVLLAVLGIGWWAWRIVRAYRAGRRASALVQAGLLAALVLPVLWMLEILPLSRNVRFQEQAEELTGKSFWGWKDASIDEASVRGEGYWLEVFTFNEETAHYFAAPDDALFRHKPSSEWIDGRGWSGWKKCPVDTADQSVFESATPIFGGWSADKVAAVQRIKDWGVASGNLYAYDGNAGNLNFYVINPSERSMAIIYSNP